MKSQADVDRIFQKFAGREVRMKEEWRDNSCLEAKVQTYQMGPGFFQPYTKVKPNWTDPTLLKMLFTTKAHGLKLFLEYPGHTVPRHAPWGPHEVRNDRVNVLLDKGADGKWRVCKGFSLG